MFPKEDTVPPSQHHHHRIFLQHLCQCFQLLHSQHHPRSTPVSSSQFLVSRTSTFLPLLQYRKPPTVWYRTMFRGRDHCLPNHSKPGNGFLRLPRHLQPSIHSRDRSSPFTVRTKSGASAHFRLGTSARPTESAPCSPWTSWTPWTWVPYTVELHE